MLSGCVEAHEIHYFLVCDQVTRMEMHEGFKQAVDAIHKEAQMTCHAIEVRWGR